MEKKNNKVKKEKRSIDKRKMAQNIIVIVLCVAMVLSVAASLIYALIMS